MEKSSRNALIRCIIFLFIVVTSVFYFIQVFDFPDSDENKQVLNTFYSEKENTLDGVYLGASSTYRYWIAPLAYDQYGFAVSSLATGSQNLILSRYLMEEAEKTQNPELYIIELRSVYKAPDNITDVSIRRVTDSMKLSSTRNNAIRDSVEYASHGKNDVTEENDYYLPIVKYHGRWSEGITKEDLLLTKIENPCKGFFATSNAYKQAPCEAGQYTDEIKPLNPYAEQVLNEFLDYCDTIHAEVLFVASPFSISEDNLKQLNYAAEIIRSRDYPVLNFNSEEMVNQVGIDFNTDFYDPKHTNFLGAEKYTRWLAAYIAENYDLADHREDADYASWEEAYQYYHENTEARKESMTKE